MNRLIITQFFFMQYTFSPHCGTIRQIFSAPFVAFYCHFPYNLFIPAGNEPDGSACGGVFDCTSSKEVAMSQKIRAKYIIAALSVTILFLVILPLFFLAPYDYASCDDFSYGIDTHHVFLQTHSVIAVLKTALSTVGHFYRTWQGSFSAIFLMAIQPAVWNEEAYCVTTYIIITFLVLSEMLLAKCVIRDCLKADHSTWLTIISLVLSVQILWVPYPVEAFFWYNGSIYYSLYYSFSLLYYCLLIRTIHRGCRWYLVPAVFLGVVIGGGNYPVALLALEISLLIILYTFRTRRERLKGILPPSAALLAAFIINVLAPGNAMRQANNTMTPAFTSVVKSLYEGALLIAKWSTLPMVIIFLALIPFLWKVIRKCACRFRCPVLVSLITIGLFSSQLTPTIYAQSYTGPGRMQNIIFYSYMFLMLINIGYWLGWIRRKVNDLAALRAEQWETLYSGFRSYLWGYCVMMFLLYMLSLPFYGYQMTTSVSAFFALRNGTAAQYRAEQRARHALLENSELAELGLPELSVKPYLLFFDDIEEDPGEWKNSAAADFYGKRKLWLIKQ